MFWVFDSEILGPAVKLEPEATLSGCQCHYNIFGLSNEVAKQIYYDQIAKNQLDFRVCSDDGIDGPITEDHHTLLLQKTA